MKTRSLIIASLLVVTSVLSSSAQTLVSNGNFETWSGGSPNLPANWTTNNSANIFQATGLNGSTYSAVAKNTGDLRQFTSASPQSFNLSFDFAVNQTSTNPGFSQSMVITIYDKTTLTDSASARIALRFQFDSASSQSAYLSAFSAGTGWVALTGKVFAPSVLNANNNGFTTLNQYHLSLDYSNGSNTYSITYGAVGGSTTTLSSLGYFRNAASGAGLKGLQFYSNDNGFALDNVVVSAVPEPGTWALLGFGLATVVVFRRRKS